MDDCPSDTSERDPATEEEKSYVPVARGRWVGPRLPDVDSTRSHVPLREN